MDLPYVGLRSGLRRLHLANTRCDKCARESRRVLALDSNRLLRKQQREKDSLA